MAKKYNYVPKIQCKITAFLLSVATVEKLTQMLRRGFMALPKEAHYWNPFPCYVNAAVLSTTLLSQISTNHRIKRQTELIHPNTVPYKKCRCNLISSNRQHILAKFILCASVLCLQCIFHTVVHSPGVKWYRLQ